MPLFRSFLQAGYECSTHKLLTGKRLDLVDSTGHDRFLAHDYSILGQFGIRTVREGIRWTRIELAPNRFDFTTVSPFLEASRAHGIEIVWDLLHFGWPDHLDIFAPEWVRSFAKLAEQFAELLKREGFSTPFIAPVNEISFVSWAGGDVAYLNPFQRGRGDELKRQLVRGALAAADAVRSVLPGAIIVSPEPVIHIAGDALKPGDREQAEMYRRSMFEAWDMMTGRLHPELGGAEKYVDVIGVNFYDRNEWWNFGCTIHRGEAEYRPFSEILREVHERYRRPMFVAETGTEGAERPAWFAYIASEVRRAIGSGVPMEGLCLYPILNHPGWDDDRHCHNGLWDYADEHGERAVFEPLAEEIRRQQLNEISRRTYENRST